MEKHGIIRGWIQLGFKHRNGVTCPWDGSEANALDKMLKSNPSWSLSDWGNMLLNYFRSDGVNGDRPRLWMPNISKFASGSLDQYGHPHPRGRRAWCEVCGKGLGESDADGDEYVCSEECKKIYESS